MKRFNKRGVELICPSATLQEQVLAKLLNPGAGMQLEPVAGYKPPAIPTLRSVLLGLVTTNPFASLSSGSILQVIVFSLFFGIAAVLAGEKGKAVIGLVESAAEIMYKLTAIVMNFAPFGVFSLIASTVAKQGASVLLPFLKVIACVYIVLILHFVACT